jgi:multidrug resistance efflux pump
MEELEFDKPAVEKLSSPEQLDQLMRVTSPRGWMAVAALTLLLGSIGAWMVFGSLPTTVTGQAILLRKGSVHHISAQESGMVTQVLVKYYDKVEANQVVARVRTDPKAPPEDIVSLYPGVVVKKLAQEGDFVQAGSTLMVLEPTDPTLEVVAYVPLVQAKGVRPGMSVEVSPSTTPREVYGFLKGTVTRVAEFPSQDTNMLDTLGNDELVKYFLNGGTTSQVVPLEIRVDLQRDTSTPSGYAWSSRKGPNFTLSAETLATANFVLGRQRPISLLIPNAEP